MYDPVDPRGVPQSRGIPTVVQIAAAIGILAIFVIAASVILSSGYGHEWPWVQALRLDLSGRG
jgi:hypothetical protein